MSRHARENPELYEDPNYSYRDQLLREGDERHDLMKLMRAGGPDAFGTLGRAIGLTDGQEEEGGAPPRVDEEDQQVG